MLKGKKFDAFALTNTNGELPPAPKVEMPRIQNCELS